MNKKQYKVWIEVEEYDPKTDQYEKIGDPLDIGGIMKEKDAHKLASVIHDFGGTIQAHGYK